MNKLFFKDLLSVCHPDWIEIDHDVFSTAKHGIPEETLDMEVKHISGLDDGLTVELFAGSSPCVHLPVGKERKNDI